MWILQNASKLTIRQRKVIAVFVMTFVITNSHVSAAHAADVSLDTTVTAVASIERADPPMIPKASLPSSPEKPIVAIRTLTTAVTAYNSESHQTDDSPFVTASGSCVHEGIVASNAFRIGTKIRLPELFGEKIFVVEDRMNARYAHRVDIWMNSATDARELGVKRNVKIEVISDGDGKKHWDEGWTNEECAQLARQ